VSSVGCLKQSGLTIYDPVPIGSPLYLSTEKLEALLRKGLAGFSIKGLPNRTRSKVVKARICEILGYPVATSFRKSQPRFPGQNFDTYVQTNDNLQIWNEPLSPDRRYVLIRESDGQVTKVRVVTGALLAALAKTDTLTAKYQARLPNSIAVELVSPADTEVIHPLTRQARETFADLPTAVPEPATLLPITEVFNRLKRLVGQRFIDHGPNQERNRGGALHRLVCSQLGYSAYTDNGQFSDVRHQLLEVKLQTAATIDLGLVTPSSTAPIQGLPGGKINARNCDVRYAIFLANTDGTIVQITGLYLTTGRDFFTRFSRCEGNIVNRKLQIPLPRGFF
jgi:hypothetical protein